MKFVLNTSFKPHFCALLSDKNEILAKTHWYIPKEDGEKIWNFLKVHLEVKSELTFIGGVSGPGSFSSLRAGGAILNALAFRFELPIHQARADKVIKDYLRSVNQSDKNFVLNSFGNRIFTVQKEKITPIEITDKKNNFTSPVIISWLPEVKAKFFTQPVTLDPLGPVNTITQTLEKTEGHKQFIPNYEYPAVQS